MLSQFSGSDIVKSISEANGWLFVARYVIIIAIIAANEEVASGGGKKTNATFEFGKNKL